MSLAQGYDELGRQIGDAFAEILDAAYPDERQQSRHGVLAKDIAPFTKLRSRYPSFTLTSHFSLVLRGFPYGTSGVLRTFGQGAAKNNRAIGEKFRAMSVALYAMNTPEDHYIHGLLREAYSSYTYPPENANDIASELEKKVTEKR